MNDKERILSGKLYNPYKIKDYSWEKSREALEKFNSMSYKQEKERMQVLRALFGRLEEDAVRLRECISWQMRLCIIRKIQVERDCRR